MSLAQIKDEMKRLTSDELKDLSEYLRSIRLRDDPEWQAELDRRCDRVLGGEGHGVAELTALHERLKAEGR